MIKYSRNICSKLCFSLLACYVVYLITKFFVFSKKVNQSFFFDHRVDLYNGTYDYQKDEQILPSNWIETTESIFVESSDFKRKFNTTKNGTHYKSPITSIFIPLCPEVPLDLGGPIEVDTSFQPMSYVEKKLRITVINGGFYRPKDCKPRERVAIIVPFRDRYYHLPIFLKNIHPFLIRQKVEYKLFIVEQTNGKLFNRAALMNIGFLEASKMSRWDCYIFHDVDLLPLDNRNLYSCPDQPRHMSVAINIFGFRLPYGTIFGGVSAMTHEQFSKVNGFSNSFWGWGGEDDDMSNRLKHANYHISRYPINIARYVMLNHPKEKANPKRYEHLANGFKKYESDGLNSIKYEIYKFKRFALFTWFLAELKVPDEN